MHQVWCTLDEAIQINREKLGREGTRAWNQREYNALKILQKRLWKNKVEKIVDNSKV